MTQVNWSSVFIYSNITMHKASHTFKLFARTSVHWAYNIIRMHMNDVSSPIMSYVRAEGWLQTLLPEVATRLLQVVGMKLKKIYKVWNYVRVYVVDYTCEVIFLYWWRASSALLRTTLLPLSIPMRSSSSKSHCSAVESYNYIIMISLRKTAYHFNSGALTDWVQEVHSCLMGWRTYITQCTSYTKSKQMITNACKSTSIWVYVCTCTVDIILFYITYRDQVDFAFERWWHLDQSHGWLWIHPANIKMNS